MIRRHATTCRTASRRCSTGSPGAWKTGSRSPPGVTPSGRTFPAGDWARSLGVAYAPSVVFFGADGREAFRIEAYVRPFHLSGSLEYVASRAYLREPNFQRYLQGRAERLREKGEAVDLWR